MAASRARSASERVSKAAASFASGAPVSAPSPSLPRSAESGVPAFAFSALLVQAAVQAAEGVGVSGLLSPLASVPLLLPKLDVAGSNPVSRS